MADETNQLEEAKVKKLEGERILKAIKKDSFTVYGKASRTRDDTGRCR